MNQHDQHPDEQTPATEQELRAAEHGHDEWFRHGPDDEAQASHGDFNPALVIGFLGLTIAATVAVTIIVLPAFIRSVNAQQAAVQENNPAYAAESRELDARWTSELTGEPAWADAQAGLARIPIGTATNAVVQEYRQRRENR